MKALLIPTLLLVTVLPSLAEDSVLTVKQATVVSTGATVTVVDSAGKEVETKPREGVYGKEQAVASVGPGDTVRLGDEGGADLLVSGDVTARLEPGTVIEIPVRGDKGGDKETESAHSIRLRKGRMFISVDAEKLRTNGKKEFRLKTPLSVLAVTGTRFVSSSDSGSDTTVLLRGDVEAVDDHSGKTGEVAVGRALVIRPGGDVSSRGLNAEEKKYGEVFERYGMNFAPVDADFRKSESDSQFFPNLGTWILRPDLLEVKPTEVAGREGKILQMKHGGRKRGRKKDEFRAEQIQLSCVVPYPAPVRRSPVGLLLAYRASTDLEVLFEGDLLEVKGGVIRIEDSVRLPKSDPPSEWRDLFIPARFFEGRVPDADARDSPLLRIIPGHHGQRPAEKSVPFVLQVSEIQAVSHGEDE